MDTLTENTPNQQTLSDKVEDDFAERWANFLRHKKDPDYNTFLDEVSKEIEKYRREINEAEQKH